MAHRSHEVSRPMKIALGSSAALALFLVAWIFVSWWVAALITAGGALLFLVAEHINWSAIDWSRLWEW
jgi:Flp pilus assembly protein TadB